MSLIPDISPGFRKKLEGFCQGSGGGVVKWDLSDLTTAPALWLDASTTDWKTGAAQDYLTLNTVPDPDTVSLWTAKIGLNASNATESEQPTTGLLNGGRFVYFINDGLLTEAVNLTQPNFIIFLGKYLTNSEVAISCSVTSARNQIYIDGSSNLALFAGSALSSATAADTDYHIFSGHFNGASSEGWLDDNSIVTGNSGGHNIVGQITVGGFSTLQTFDGHFIDVIVLNYTPTTDEIDQIWGYLGWKLKIQYGDSSIVNAFDPGFAYKSTFPTV